MKTKETNPTRPGSPTPCKQALILNFSRLHCLAIPKRDLSTTKRNVTRKPQIHVRIIKRFHSRGQHPCKLIGTKESVCIRKEFNTGVVWDTNMAAASLFWDTNMATVTSCENTLFFIERGLLRTITKSLWAPLITNKIKNKKQTDQLISDLLQSYLFFNYFF